MGGSSHIVLFVLVLLLTLSNVHLCICTTFEVQCIPSERDALLLMKHHLSDPSNRLVSWSPYTNCCNWDSVVCHNITGHVVELHLSSPPPPSEFEYETSRFGGEVHPSLLNLKHLNYLDLSNNYFGGMKIPGFLGLMTSLTYLNLSHAGFYGSIPIQYWNLSNLIYLNLGINDLEGSIPHQLGKLSNLKYLDLSDNEFNGSIPIQLWNLSKMIYLDLGRNILKGSIPHRLGKLSNLQYLDLSSNEFNGNILHQIGNLSNLINLHLGGISIESLHWFLTLSSLQYLELSYVNLSNAFDWLQVLHSLPSLRELQLLQCDFNHYFEPSSLNFSCLVVLNLFESHFVNSMIPNWIFQLKELVQLQLRSNGFHGSIPDGIQNLTQLQHLDLSENGLNSSIPGWMYSFSHLKSFILHSNSLVGTVSPNIGNLTSLVTLDLSENLLEWPIPISMGDLCNLKQLDFSNNKWKQRISRMLEILSAGCVSQTLETFYASSSQLSGYLTDHIGLFNNLVGLYLWNNSIQGALPNSLGNLKSLKYLNLAKNTINSSIPISFGNLKSLVDLDLSQNQLDGNPFEILGSLSILKAIYLEYNLFQGVVKGAHLVNFTQLYAFSAKRNQLSLTVDPNWNPSFQFLKKLSLASWNLGPHFPSWIQSLKHLDYLDISNATVCDSIPTSFWGTSANLLYLNLSHNHIEGELSNTFVNITFIGGVVDLSSNKLYGQLPHVSHDVGYIDLSSNRFSGSIAHFLCHQQEETKPLLDFLNLSSNNLSGNIPDCWIMWPFLMKVDLENNHFTGSLHTSMASLPELEMLNLHNNNFAGNFPSFLKNKSNLISLDLGENQFSGMVPSWVGKGLSSLKILVLRSNKFSGPIPHQICNMSALQILDLAHNKLIGHIPPCVKHLSAMLVINSSLEPSIYFEPIWFSYGQQLLVEALLLKGRVYDYSTILGLITSIDFSCNELSGEIPIELTRLKGLLFLNLSNNHFIGQIPQNIGNMVSLESMDFSRNNLSGEIPQGMSKLSFLSMLNLSYNNLMGKIPTGTQLQSYEASSFVGNDLCGPPLSNNCSSNSSNNKEKDVVPVKGINWFFVGMGFGFIMGFWVVVGPLLFSSSWRYTYFQFLDQMWYKFQSCCY